MKTNIVYVLNCPITKKPVYVGKSTQGVERPFKHIEEKSHSDKVNRWAKYLKEKGKEPQVYLVENDVDDNLLDAKETFWINYYLTKGNLLLNQKGIDPVLLFKHNTDNIDDPLNDIRSYIVNKRKQLNLTQIELSEKAGVALTVIRKIEQGKSNIQMDSLFSVLRILGNVKIGIID
jgi:DNA-binding XRE family transcriptional regulator